MTQQELDAIRERLASLPAHILPDWVSSDIAALLAHADRFAALTPEVIETAIEALILLEYGIPANPARHDAYAAARAALESLKEKP